jgi:hypothetical protein
MQYLPGSRGRKIECMPYGIQQLIQQQPGRGVKKSVWVVVIIAWFIYPTNVVDKCEKEKFREDFLPGTRSKQLLVNNIFLVFVDYKVFCFYHLPKSLTGSCIK